MCWLRQSLPAMARVAASSLPPMRRSCVHQVLQRIERTDGAEVRFGRALPQAGRSRSFVRSVLRRSLPQHHAPVYAMAPVALCGG
mmetsp:Transcript_41124/g.126984  ORF Transcript_41124/g.126984 Transcript_41124/m.126984 type:complete len:85 (-) Transcript_41124:75-329(-)